LPRIRCPRHWQVGGGSRPHGSSDASPSIVERLDPHHGRGPRLRRPSGRSRRHRQATATARWTQIEPCPARHTICHTRRSPSSTVLLHRPPPPSPDSDQSRNLLTVLSDCARGFTGSTDHQASHRTRCVAGPANTGDHRTGRRRAHAAVRRGRPLPLPRLQQDPQSNTELMPAVPSAAAPLKIHAPPEKSQSAPARQGPGRARVRAPDGESLVCDLRSDLQPQRHTHGRAPCRRIHSVSPPRLRLLKPNHTSAPTPGPLTWTSILNASG
jgi:hypothetical protein